MRKFTFLVSAIALISVASKAQTVADFEALSLSGTDTAYINYSAPGTDVGFSNGLAYFPCVYDTGFGSGYWSYGFVYSNMTDSVTSGFTNQYSAITAKGYGGSAKYLVSYGIQNKVKLTGYAVGKPVNGFYVTNNTYAYNSMRDGDTYAKKFGDTTGTGITTGQGTAPDWFKIQARAFFGGVLKPDTLDFYLADFRPAGTANDSIIRAWHWFDLSALGHADSLQFTLKSSDNGSFGMNTPAYFCMDNFTTNETLVAVKDVNLIAAKVYPNPAVDLLNIDLDDDNFNEIDVIDVRGNTIIKQRISALHTEINTATLGTGMYMLKLSGANKVISTRFVKK